MEKNCGNCQYEPDWQGGKYSCFHGYCNHKLTDETLPSCMTLMEINKNWYGGEFQYKAGESVVRSCPTWKPKDTDNE